MEMLSGAEMVVQSLVDQGVKQVFGYPGGAVLDIYDALHTLGGIDHVLVRHEQAAVHMADGLARATGEVGVVLVTSGPGATNAITGIATAYMDSIPLVILSGQVATSLIGYDAFQECDMVGISRPVVKHSFLVKQTEDIPGVLKKAFWLAASGRPGPVVVDLPKDILNPAKKLPYVWPDAVSMRSYNPTTSGHKGQIKRALQTLVAASKPVVYVGGGAINAHCEPQLRELVEKLKLPVASSLMGLGAFPATHSQALGMLGMHGARSTNFILQEADLLIVLGARFDDRAIGKTEQFCPNAKIIHVDIDRAELGKIKQPHVAIQGDVAEVLAQLNPQIEAQPREEWRQLVADLQREFPCAIPQESDPLSHYGLINAVAACVDDEAIITTDVGQHQMWTAQAYPLNRPRQWLTSGGLGTMGFGLPAAVGAALANPDRKVICFSGDGSLMMNIQEMATAAENQLDVKIILMNNEALGLVHQQQSLFYKQGVFAATYPGMINFMQIAAGFGLHTCDLNAEEDAHAALQAAISRPGPALIHVRIDSEQKVYPMVPPGAANTEMVGE